MSNSLLEAEPSRQQLKAMHEAVHDYYHAPDPGEKMHHAKRTQSLGFRRALFVAAGMFIEAANSADMPGEDKAGAFDRGVDVYQAIVRKGTRGRLISHTASAAALRLATIDSTKTLILDNRLPSSDELLIDYEKLVEQGQISAEQVDAYYDGDNNGYHVGNVSEASALLLLMRFGINHGGDEYAPFYSFVSEDLGDSRGATQGKRWDISVYTQLAEYESPALANRLQVKTARSFYANRKGPYKGHIPVVHMVNDLEVLDHPMDITSVIHECAEEFTQGTPEIIETLDLRTRKLTDIMG